MQLGAASLLFRQTNIVWVLFVAAQAALREVSRAGAADRVRDPLLVDAQPCAFTLAFRLEDKDTEED